MSARRERLRVTCPAGTIEGWHRGTHHQFLGIPYAQPPLGPRRLQPPQPIAPQGWQALAPRPAPPQRAGRALALRPVGDVSEDCLHLNITVPASPGPHPVWVWIYGGGFTNGDAQDPLHDGAHLAESLGVVVVTFNYRLGLLGFPPLAEAANLGLLDQQAALRWVRENIAAFGGDENRITVMGESAGGMSILSQLTLAGSEDTFQRAVVQSAATSPWLDPDAVARCHHWLSAHLGTPALLPTLQALTLPALLQLGQDLDTALRGTLGHGVFRPQAGAAGLGPTEEAGLAAAAHRGIPLLLGCTAHEQRLFLFPQRALTQEGALGRLRKGLSHRRRSPCPDPRALWNAYLETLGPQPPWQTLAAAETDLYYQVPTLERARAYGEAHRAEGADALWLYRFDAVSPALRGQLGASHGLDVPFLFGTLAHPSVVRFAGADPVRQQLAATLQQAWLAFSTGQNPGWASWNPRRPETGHFDLAGLSTHPTGADLCPLWASAPRSPHVDLP